MQMTTTMQNYKVKTLKRNEQASAEMEFTAKDDLAADEIAHKFAKMNKGFGYKLWRKTERGAWHDICIDVISKALRKA